MAITFQTLVMNSGSWFRASAMTTMNKKPTRYTIVLKSLNFIVFLFRSTCFGLSCAHHQEPPSFAHTASSHRVSLGWLYLTQSLSDRPKLEDTTNPTTHGDWRLYWQN